MDFDNLMEAVVVDHLENQKMDLNFDKDLIVVDTDLVDYHYLLKKYRNNSFIFY